jgi:hypothetical protein
VNGTLNVNETVELAERAARAIADLDVGTMRDSLEIPK